MKYTEEFFCCTFVLMEWCFPIFTLVLTPKATHLLQSRSCFCSVSSIVEKMASDVDAEVRHISKNLVVTQPLFTSNILTVKGFIFFKPESLDPSVAKENGLLFMTSIKDFCKSLAKAPFIMHADLCGHKIMP